MDLSVDSTSHTDDRMSSLELEVSIGSATFAASGHGELVINAFADFQSLLRELPDLLQNFPSAPLVEQSPPIENVETRAGTVQGDLHNKSNESDEPLPIFLRKRPGIKTNASVAAGIVVWSKRHRGIEELSIDEVKNWWSQSGRKPAGNLRRDLGKATTEGWLRRLESGAYAPTVYGENYLDSLLENSEK